MNMKKNLTILFCALVCLMTGCNKNNSTDPQPQEETTDKTPAFVQMTFTIPVTEDMLNYTDITITYNDGTGEKSEALTTLQWSKTLKVALPATLSFKRAVSMKSSASLGDDAVTFYPDGYAYSFSILNAAGKDLEKGGFHTNTSTITGKGSLFAEKVNTGNYNKSHSYSFDKQGNLAE